MELTLQNQLSGLEALEQQILSLDTYKAYLMAQQLEKMAKSIKQTTKAGFEIYFDEFKDLPLGFECKISQRATYNFAEDQMWSNLKALLDAREEEIKMACKMQDKNQIFSDKNGEIVNPVTRTFSEIYSVSRWK